VSKHGKTNKAHIMNSEVINLIQKSYTVKW